MKNVIQCTSTVPKLLYRLRYVDYRVSPESGATMQYVCYAHIYEICHKWRLDIEKYILKYQGKSSDGFFFCFQLNSFYYKEAVDQIRQQTSNSLKWVSRTVAHANNHTPKI